uniref:ATP-binding protein n=1 Tax=Streptomyces sp. NRRL B-24051 TaxID=1463832 RepID=UPI0004C9D4A6|nr:ATP-binding protein [Streptomyces sp. NRRL B-24051]
MRTRNREPQTLASEGTLDRMARILAARNIDPAAVAELVDEPEPFSPLDALSAGMPPRYQAAVADHPQVLAWAREVAEAAVAPSPGRDHRRRPVRRPAAPARGRQRAGAGGRQPLPAADLYADLRPRPGVDSERGLAAVSRCPLLIIDDLGAAKASEWVEEVTYRLINRRYNHMLPTLITTNLAIKDLKAYLGDRVTSRLAQMTTRVEFQPVDRRRHRTAA